jgi:hypothetical protein
MGGTVLAERAYNGRANTALLGGQFNQSERFCCRLAADAATNDQRCNF